MFLLFIAFLGDNFPPSQFFSINLDLSKTSLSGPYWVTSDPKNKTSLPITEKGNVKISSESSQDHPDRYTTRMEESDEETSDLSNYTLFLLYYWRSYFIGTYQNSNFPQTNLKILSKSSIQTRINNLLLYGTLSQDFELSGERSFVELHDAQY